MEFVNVQMIFDILIGLVSFLGGWILNTIKEEQHLLAISINEINTKALPQKIDKDDFNIGVDRIMDQLNRIETKVDGKADKSDNGFRPHGHN